MVERTKLERIHIRDRPRTHRKNIAQDPADASRRTLIWLDERRVVVALDFEDSHQAIANIDGTSVFARATDYERALRRQHFEVFTRRLVGAMLRPHHGK